MAEATVTIHQTTNGYYFIENNIKYLNVKHGHATNGRQASGAVRNRIRARHWRGGGRR